MRNILIRLFVNAVALWVAARLVSGIQLTEDLWSIVLVAAVFGIVNALIKPIALFFSLPFLLLTLGLFTLVINALMLLMTDALLSSLEVEGFWAAFLGSLVISVVSILFSALLPDGERKERN
jgi:putative membrane protein